MTSFRDSAEGCSGLVFSKSLNKWICGGSLGQAFELTPGGEGFTPIAFNSDDSAVTAVAVADNQNLLAHSAADSVTLRLLSNLEEAKEALVVRRTLPISHLQFTSSGNHL